jgi:uncharacterized protein YdeI (YjbR/CyaY-like superfamily)
MGDYRRSRTPAGRLEGDVILPDVPVDPTFFATPANLRAWLEAHHQTSPELWVGFYKKGSGRPSITWPEAVDEALCVGWIDGVRKGLDGESYVIRFTPRQPRSIWSAVNIKRVEGLTRLGLVRPAGLKAFAERAGERSRIYAYEQDGATLGEEQEREFRANPAAWDFFQARRLLSPDGDLVGDQREEGRDPPQAARHAHRGFGAREHDCAADAPTPIGVTFRRVQPSSRPDR